MRPDLEYKTLIFGPKCKNKSRAFDDNIIQNSQAVKNTRIGSSFKKFRQ